MTVKPYPGFPPNYQEIPETGGYKRTCFVLEFLTLGPLSDAQVALIEEQMGAVADKLLHSMSIAEKVDFVVPARFDRPLCEGLRIPYQE